MQKKDKYTKPSPMIRLLNIFILILLFAALLAFGRMIHELYRASSRDPYGNIEYSLQDGEYADMIHDYFYRNYDVAPFRTVYEESYHVAEYANAAFLHQFFQAVHDPEMADRLKTSMQEARVSCGSLSVATGDIDQLLNSISLFP